MKTLKVKLRRPHPKQREFIESPAKRKVIRAGRRGGKTTGIAIMAVQRFLDGSRVLYTTPTQEQVERFWYEVKKALAQPIDRGVFTKNESTHVIELPDTQQRIRAKTAWNADTLRGDYGDLLIFDEYQLMSEDAWERVGAPMLMDNNGDAMFVYTPASLRSKSITKARDPLHAAKMWRAAKDDPRWGAFHFTSFDNPHLPREAIHAAKQDMTALAFRQEIMAEDVEDIPGALWKRGMIKYGEAPESGRVVVGIDPAATKGGDETGIIVAMTQDNRGYVLDDLSGNYSPKGWAGRAIGAYHDWKADRVIGEINNGGEMIEEVLRMIDPAVSYKSVRASRGKATRAEPIAALYERGRILHVREFTELEEQMCGWVEGVGMASPDRLDALVWSFHELMLHDKPVLDMYSIEL